MYGPGIKWTKDPTPYRLIFCAISLTVLGFLIATWLGMVAMAVIGVCYIAVIVSRLLLAERRINYEINRVYTHEEIQRFKDNDNESF